MHMNSSERRERLKSSRTYQWMRSVARYMDQYYLDGIAGLVPGGLGDTTMGLFALVHLYFSLFKLHSIPLTLAIANNVLRDILMGMLPFFVGDIIDFLNKAHMKNMALIDGFINDDKAVVHEVNRKALWSVVILVVLIAAIVGMAYALIWLTKALGTVLFS